MSISRIFQPVTLTLGTVIQLDEAASHHLSRVLRANVNDKVVIFNSQNNGEYESVITHVTKKNVDVRIEKFHVRNVESSLDLWLVQGISRGEKMDYTIQKAVELGVKKIIPVFTERCTVKLDDERREKRWQHWRAIMISACEQCGRVQLPELNMPVPLKDWLQEEIMMDVAFVLAPQAKTNLKKLQIDSHARVVLLIGPEGGLSQEEVDFASKKKFVPLNLGPRILRTETAGMAALAVLQGFFGDLAGY